MPSGCSRGAVGLVAPPRPLFYLLSYLPHEQEPEPQAASFPGPPLSPLPSGLFLGAWGCHRAHGLLSSGVSCSGGGPRAGSDWREPSPSAPRFWISSVRIGEEKKSGKADLTLQLSAGECGKPSSTWRAGREANPHPGKEAKAVTVRGQVSEGKGARARVWMGKLGAQPAAGLASPAGWYLSQLLPSGGIARVPFP